MNKATAFAAAGLIGCGSLLTSPTAQAQQTDQPTTSEIVIAEDTSRLVTATPSGPRAIDITAAPGTLIRIYGAGQKTRTVRTDRDGHATVKKLTAGKTYRVRTAESSTTVTPINKAGAVRNLRVTTTGDFNTVRLTWRHKAINSRGGAAIAYTVTAEPLSSIDAAIDPVGTSDSDEGVIVEEVATTEANLVGLDPNVRYRFRVAAHNALGHGKASTAVMDRSLSDIDGWRAPVAEQPAETPRTPTEALPTTPPATRPSTPPAPMSPPAATPARIAKPTTKTIYVCPDGFTDDDGLCTRTMAYTYQTQEYTYHQGKIGTKQVLSRCSSGYTDEQGNFHWIEQPHDCWRTQDVIGDIKDTTPAGWEDTGSHWRKRDDTPAEWSDDGSQWVQTAEKIEKVVPV